MFFKRALLVHKECAKLFMKKEIKVPRGYRLFPRTQKLILKIQKILNSDADKAISSACENYLNEFAKTKNLKTK